MKITTIFKNKGSFFYKIYFHLLILIVLILITYILYIYFSIKISILFILIIILVLQKKYINILKIILKNVLKLLITYSSLYLINNSDIITTYFMDSDLFKLLSYLLSLYVTMYTIYLVYKDIRKLWAAPDAQAELKEKLDKIFDKYKKESDNDNIFDKLKKEIIEIIKEND